MNRICAVSFLQSFHHFIQTFFLPADRFPFLLFLLLLVVQPRVEKKGLQLILEIDENIPNELYGDEVRIRQIITNILTNAVKYTEEGSVTFRVQMERKDTRHVILKVAVKDTGIGIKESKERYARAVAEELLGAKGYTPSKRYLPIPQSEIDKSEGTLHQNNY